MKQTKQKIFRRLSKKEGGKSKRKVMDLGDGQVLQDTT